MPPCIGTHEVFSFPPKSLLATDLVDVDDVDLRCGALSLSHKTNIDIHGCPDIDLEPKRRGLS